MNIRLGECYAVNKWYNVIVTLNEDTDDEVEISCSASTSCREDILDEYLMEVTVTNPEDLPKGVTEDDIIDEVKEEWDNL